MIARLKPAFDVIDTAIAGHLFPGATLAIGYKGELALKPFGRGGYEQNLPLWPPGIETTNFDEPAISACIAVLASSKQLTLDTPVFRVIPEWASGPDAERHKKVTIRHLLEHTSGLAPSYKGYSELFSEPLVSDPGTKYQPSRSNFELLAASVARLSGQSFKSFAYQHIFERIGRAKAYSLEPFKVMAPSYGKFEGLSQHELSAADMAAFSQLWLNRGIYAHNHLYPRNLVELMTRRSEIGGSAFTAGWSAPSEEEGTGKYLSSEAYGYTHMWGDSVWIDPAKDLFIVFMPAFQAPSKVRDKFNTTRAALHDAVIEGLGITPQR
jgi:CubicO group peptidase (beta-lactamase class C family)